MKGRGIQRGSLWRTREEWAGSAELGGVGGMRGVLRMRDATETRDFGFGDGEVGGECIQCVIKVGEREGE